MVNKGLEWDPAEWYSIYASVKKKMFSLHKVLLKLLFVKWLPANAIVKTLWAKF